MILGLLRDFNISQIPEHFPPNYLKTYDVYLWWGAVLVGVIGSIIFLQRAKKSKIDIQKSLLIGMAAFLFLYSLMRIAFISAVLVAEGNLYDEFTILGYILGLTGLGGFLFGIERGIVKKTHMMLSTATFIVSAMGTIFLIFGYDRLFVMDFTYAVSMADTALMLILYLWLIKSSAGVIRTRTFIAFLGILLIFLGMALDSEAVFSIYSNMPLFIAPILTILGLSILTYIQRY